MSEESTYKHEFTFDDLSKIEKDQMLAEIMNLPEQVGEIELSGGGRLTILYTGNLFQQTAEEIDWITQMARLTARQREKNR